jgi:hypothetical protein
VINTCEWFILTAGCWEGGDEGLVLAIKNKLKRAARNWLPKMQILTLSLERKTLSPSQEGGKRAGVVHFNFCGLGGGK